jgi:hypothetical protein
MSEKEEWFLHFSNESVVVFGCTELFAQTNNLELQSIPYPQILKDQIYYYRVVRQNKIIADYIEALRKQSPQIK